MPRPCTPSSGRSLTACALLASSLFTAAASAQVIIVGPPGAGGTTAVPVDHPLALGLLLAALALAGWWHLRRGGAAHRVLAWVLVGGLGVAAYGFGGGSALQALPGNAFTNPAGQSLPIPVTATHAGGYFTGFGVQDFYNGSGKDLRVNAIVPPNNAQCFTGGAQAASKLLQPGTPAAPGTPCSVGLTLADGDSCRVDVDSICRGLLGTPPTLTGVSPANGAAAGGTTATLTGTGLTGATAVNFGGVAGTGMTVVSSSTVTAATPHVGGTMDVTVETPSGMARLASAYSAPYEVGQILKAQGGVVASMNGAVPQMIAAEVDQSGSTIWGPINDLNNPSDGSGVSIGPGGRSSTDGAANTLAIITKLSPTYYTAAQVCVSLALGGFTDWYLPAKDELNVLYTEQAAIGGFSAANYWSSTEDPWDPFGPGWTHTAWVQFFNGGSQVRTNKTNGYRMRCVRQYTP